MPEIQISLAAARVNAGLTQDDVAREMQITRATVVNWEKGRTVPKISEMEKMSRLYGIDQSYIFLPSYSTKSR